MTYIVRISLVALVTAALTACSSSSDPPPEVQNTGGGGMGGSSGVGGTGGDTTGGGTGGTGGESACKNLGGPYTKLSGSCSNPNYQYPPVLCVRQNGCNATVYGTGQLQLEGSISGETGTFTTEKPIHETCVAQKQPDGSATIHCEATSVGITCDGVSQPVAVKDSTETCCNVKMQDCTDATQRCQIVSVGDNLHTTACIPVTGSKQKGETCERITDDDSGIGRDNCAKGLFCASWGVIGDGRVCSPLCDASSDCGTDERCFSTGAAPRGGACATICDPFASPSTCPNGSACHDVRAAMDLLGDVPMTLCSAVGSAVEGESCQSTSNCTAGTRCASGICRTLCDKDHPCNNGKTCKPLFSKAMPPLKVSFGMCE